MARRPQPYLCHRPLGNLLKAAAPAPRFHPPQTKSPLRTSGFPALGLGTTPGLQARTLALPTGCLPGWLRDAVAAGIGVLRARSCGGGGWGARFLVLEGPRPSSGLAARAAFQEPRPVFSPNFQEVRQVLVYHDRGENPGWTQSNARSPHLVLGPAFPQAAFSADSGHRHPGGGRSSLRLRQGHTQRGCHLVEEGGRLGCKTSSGGSLAGGQRKPRGHLLPHCYPALRAAARPRPPQAHPPSPTRLLQASVDRVRL